MNFHALPEEIAPVLEACANEFQLHVSRVSGMTTDTARISGSEIQAAFRDPSLETVLITVARPVMTRGQTYYFLVENRDTLVLDVGRLVNAGLKGSWLSSRATDEETYALWRKVKKRFGAVMKAGSVFVVPPSKVSHAARDHWFSAGAKRLDGSGTIMLSFAGPEIYHFP